jgi:polysaccharide export outer membrane protein
MAMAHRSLIASLAAAALLPALCENIAAQQMTPPSQSQNGFPAGSTARNAAPTSADALRGSQLTVVPPGFADLKLAPGFLVSLSVLDDPDFNGDFRIDQNGDLTIPVLGAVHVAGESASDARNQIQQRLQSGQILKDPQVTLTVIQYAALEVTIIGEVAAPGRYPLLAPESLTDVIALAGGLTVASGNEIQITHSGKDTESTVVHYSKATASKAVQDTIIQPGDTVQIKRAGIVYVLGAVNRAGGYVMQEDGTLTALEAISIANGTTLPASVGTIYLLRRNADGSAIKIELPLSKMQRGKSADMQLQAADILYVPVSKIKETFLNTQGILTAATSATIYATAVY